MDILPIEVVDLILSYLDWDTLERAASVCVSWWNIILEQHFYPYLAAQDYCVQMYLASKGWTPSCSDVGLITKLVKKVRQNTPITWFSCKPSVRTKIVEHEYNYNFAESLVYKDKLYLYKMKSSVDVYSLNTLEKIYTLKMEEAEGHYWGKLNRYDTYGLFCTFPVAVQKENNGQGWLGDKFWLYNLETDELVWRTETTEPFLHLVMNNTMIVGLFESSCQSWMLDKCHSQPHKKDIQSKDFYLTTNPTENNDWKIQMVAIDSDWLVAQGQDTDERSFKVCQLEPSGEMGPTRRLKCLILELEDVTDSFSYIIDDILLNGQSLLAVSMNYDNGECHDLRVIDIRTDTEVANFHGYVHCWSCDWFFVENAWTG